MTKTQFNKLKVGDFVKVIHPINGYSVADNVITTDLGPYVSRIRAIGNGLVELEHVRYSGAQCVFHAAYLQLISKVRKRG